jgi:hypothetical protein
MKTSEIIIILDRSGSMGAIHKATVDGINTFIDDLRRVPGEGFWTFVQFDDRSSAKGAGEAFPHVLYERRPDREMVKLTEHDFRPRGGTALIDAVCITLLRTEQAYLATPGPERLRTLIVIMTDGHENSSVDYNRDKMREIIARCQSQHGFEFIFLGANQDAFAEASGYGMATNHRGGHCNKLRYDPTPVGTQAVLNAAASNARSWKLDGNDSAEGMIIDPEPRSEAPAKAEEKGPANS